MDIVTYALCKKYADSTSSETSAEIEKIKEQLAGLSGAMHFIGISTTDPTGDTGPTIEGVTSYSTGDFVIYSSREFVYNGTKWIELGDEESHLTKASADTYYVPLTRMINGVSLTTDIVLTTEQITDAVSKAVYEAKVAELEESIDKSSFTVGDYDEETGEVTITYGANVSSVSYTEDTGIMEFTY